MTLTSGKGSEVNKIKIGQTNVLLGDPNVKPEKPYTIIQFPGGHVEIARTSTDEYWVHVTTRHDIDTKAATIVNCRIDCDGRYADDANATLKSEIAQGDVSHIAFLVSPNR